MFNKLNTLSWLVRVLSHFQLSFSLPSSFSLLFFVLFSLFHFLSLFCNLFVEERESLSCSFPQSRFCWQLFLCCYLKCSLIHSIVLKLLFSSRLETHSVSGSTFWQYCKGNIVYHHQMPHKAFLSLFSWHQEPLMITA